MHAAKGDCDIRLHQDLSAAQTFILVDHTYPIWQHLIQHDTQANVNSTPSKKIHIILDNAGAELFNDLCLADVLVSWRLTHRIVFHMKSFPWFVSDTLQSDIDYLMHELEQVEVGDPVLADLVKRWKGYWQDGIWSVQCHPFWVSFHAYWQMEKVAPDLYHVLTDESALLLIFKGR
jgi:hypothetical protein